MNSFTLRLIDTHLKTPNPNQGFANRLADVLHFQGGSYVSAKRQISAQLAPTPQHDFLQALTLNPPELHGGILQKRDKQILNSGNDTRAEFHCQTALLAMQEGLPEIAETCLNHVLQAKPPGFETAYDRTLVTGIQALLAANRDGREIAPLISRVLNNPRMQGSSFANTNGRLPSPRELMQEVLARCTPSDRPQLYETLQPSWSVFHLEVAQKGVDRGDFQLFSFMMSKIPKDLTSQDKELLERFVVTNFDRHLKSPDSSEDVAALIVKSLKDVSPALHRKLQREMIERFAPNAQNRFARALLANPFELHAQIRAKLDERLLKEATTPDKDARAEHHLEAASWALSQGNISVATECMLHLMSTRPPRFLTAVYQIFNQLPLSALHENLSRMNEALSPKAGEVDQRVTFLRATAERAHREGNVEQAASTLELTLQSRPDDFAVVLQNTVPRMLMTYLQSKGADQSIAIRMANTLKENPQKHVAALRILALRFPESLAQDAAAQVAYHADNSEIKNQLLQIIGESDGGGHSVDILARKVLQS